MRIVIDVAPLSHPRTGVGNYIRGSLLGLAQAGARDVVAFAPASRAGRRTIEESLDGVDASGACRSCLRRMRCALRGRASARRRWRPSSAPSTSSISATGCIRRSAAGVRSTMIHDLVPLHFPDWVHRRTVRMHGAKYRHAAQACDVVVVNSRFTGDDVVETLGIDRDRVHVAYPGVDPAFTPEGARAEGEYLLAVGTLEPRKNLVHADRGGAAARRRAARRRRARLGRRRGAGQGRARRLGYPSDSELPALYRGAAAFVYPSRFEGFGIPCSRRWRAARRASSRRIRRSTRPRARQRCARTPTTSMRSRPAIERARDERDGLVALGLEHARRFTWLENGRAHLAAWEAAR